MTADGTYPVTRTGETVTTAAELDALPVGTIVRGRSGMLSRGNGTLGPTWYHYPSRDHAADSGIVAEVEGALTVLFRPDDQQPATGDAVERAARAMAAVGDADGWVDEIAEWEGREQWERDAHPESYPSHAYEDREAFRSQARAALAAARAGEAEGDIVQEMAEAIDDATFSHLSPAENLERQANAAARVAAQRGGEAADREAVLRALRPVLCNASNYPRQVQPHILGRDMGPLLAQATDAVLAARGDAAPTVSVDLAALHRSEETTIRVPVFDEFDSPYQFVTRCRECQRPWPCKTAVALGIEVS